MDDKRQPQAAQPEQGHSLSTDIYSVHYQKLVNLGNFENERVGAWAAVPPGQTPEQAIEALKAWVGRQVGQHGEMLNLQEDVNELRHQKDVLEYEVQKAKEAHAKVKAYLESIGLEMPARYTAHDDMPW